MVFSFCGVNCVAHLFATEKDEQNHVQSKAPLKWIRHRGEVQAEASRGPVQRPLRGRGRVEVGRIRAIGGVDKGSIGGGFSLSGWVPCVANLAVSGLKIQREQGSGMVCAAVMFYIRDEFLPSIKAPVFWELWNACQTRKDQKQLSRLLGSTCSTQICIYLLSLDFRTLRRAL